jgi:indole-3-glycerol phosphate synthase
MSRRTLSDFFDEMKKRKEEEVRIRLANRPAAMLEKVAAEKEAPPDFAAALSLPSGGRVRLIAEMKKASPSAGVIREAFEPLAQARLAVQAGASAISVLTEEDFFQGSLQDLSRVAAGVPAPVMRKDFIIDTYQLLEARVAGAAACLLIVAMLDPPRLNRLLRDTADLGMTALVEAHDRRDLDIALEAGASVVGINNRNLKTMEVDTGTTLELKEFIPPGKIVVSESGHRTRADLVRLEEAGIEAVLIGEAIMRADDIGNKVRELIGFEGRLPPGLRPHVDAR